MILSGRSIVAGVIGWPAGHSRSPRLHGYWLQHHAIDGAYVPFAVPPERLYAALRALPALGIAGVNVTIPHKEAVASLVDELDTEAARIGAVNTVIVRGDGRLLGSNSDSFGFLASLREGAPDWQAGARPATILGAGGAARAVAVALLSAGVTELRLVNRTAARGLALAAALGAPVRAVPWEQRAAALDGAGLLVNATSLGMSGQPALELSLVALPEQAVVLDIVYVPLRTSLLQRAAERGNRVIDGLGMLLHQARPGFAAWFGVEPQVTPELRAFVLGE